MLDKALCVKGGGGVSTTHQGKEGVWLVLLIRERRGCG